jgi:hypothetical protein
MPGGDKSAIQISTSLAEIYRDAKKYRSLVFHYDAIGNLELRDKYIELALKNKPSDGTVVYLRCLQGKQNLIPKQTIKRLLAFYTKHKDWLQRGRVYKNLGMKREAVRDYIQGLSETLLKEGNVFTTAYYLKEFVESGLLKDLFVHAYEEAEKRKDLWWQIRALQELGWNKEVDALVLKHKKSILKKKEPLLLQLLAKAQGDTKGFIDAEKAMAQPGVRRLKVKSPTTQRRAVIKK